MRLATAFLIAGLSPAAADPLLTVTAEHEGFRDYYCLTLGTLTNGSDEVVQEINGHFLIFQNGEQVGRSYGTSFLNVAPGEVVEASFAAPNAPCETADSYEFVIGACRQDNSFTDTAECAARISGVGAVSGISAR